MNKALINHLLSYLSNERASVFQNVIQHRTRYLTVVLEDIYQSQNASAVLRTCDCFGIQDVHIIENENQFDINPRVVRGATKWINLIQYKQSENNSYNAICDLKAKGYRIIATSPHSNDVGLEEFDIKNGKFALFFGTEHSGISSIVQENADEFLKIPMYGFTESFNLSVSAAIVLHHLTFLLKNSNVKYKLSEIERDELLLEWLKQSVKGSKYIIQDYLNKQNAM